MLRKALSCQFSGALRLPYVKASRRMLASFGKFLRCYDSLTATTPAMFLSGLQPSMRSLPDQVALELRQCPEQVEHEAAA